MFQSIKQLYSEALRALDGEIGHLKDFYFDDTNWAVRYLVADTGSWIAGRLVLLAPHAFGSLPQDGKVLLVNLTRKQIENSPSIDTHRPVSRQFEEEYYQYYGWPQTNPETGEVVKDQSGKVVLDYNMVIPNMLLHYFHSGMLGLGLTAPAGQLYVGMAGNVTAFNTVWTYEIFKAYIKRDATDANLLLVGQLTTFFGVALSVGVAYFVAAFNNIMDVLQLVFAFVNAPLFATFLLGMFWKRATGHGAFFDLLSGTVAAAIHHGLTISEGSTPGVKGAWIATVHVYPSQMAQNFYTAIYAWTVCFLVTIVISLLTKPRPAEELKGLVYALTENSRETSGRWFLRPVPVGIAVLLLTLFLM